MFITYLHTQQSKTKCTDIRDNGNLFYCKSTSTVLCIFSPTQNQHIIIICTLQEELWIFSLQSNTLCVLMKRNPQNTLLYYFYFLTCIKHLRTPRKTRYFNKYSALSIAYTKSSFKIYLFNSCSVLPPRFVLWN